MVAFYDPPEAARFHRWIERQRTGAERLRGDRPVLLRERVEGLVQSLTFQL